MNQQQIAFMGRITAGLSHEINNVLAIIKESAGLMDDILSLSPENVAPHRDRLAKASASIRKQVERGVEIVTGLNRFAHSMDEPWVHIDLNELTSRMVFLMQRFGRQRRIRLSALSCPEPVTIETDPFRLEMILASALDFCLTRASEGTGLVVQPRITDGQPSIWVGPESDAPAGGFDARNPCPEDLTGLRADLTDLKADIFDVGRAGLPGVLIQFK